MPQLILLRHGRSTWNLRNLFTGWVDIPIAAQGRADAAVVAEKLKGYDFDAIYVSQLSRAIETMLIATSKFENGKVPVIQHGLAQEAHRVSKLEIPAYSDRALNERHYGKLQGMDKTQTAEKYGEEQVRIWRRSYDVRPPGGESLKDTVARVMPYFKKHILKRLKKGENVLIVAHGNSLRAIVKELEQLTPKQVTQVEIPFDKFLRYEFKSGHVVGKKII